jgi:hypothetical protein
LATDKSKALAASEVASVAQARQLDNPDARVSAEELSAGELLETVAYASKGTTTGDDPCLKRLFWELRAIDSSWEAFLTSVDSNVHYGGRSFLIDWHDNGSGMYRRRAASQNLGAQGIAISQMRDLPSTLYLGERYDTNIGPITPIKPQHLPALWCYCSSPEYHDAVRAIDNSLKVTNATLVKVPFDIDRWTAVAKDRYPHGLPQPYSDDPAQWIFHGHPCGSVVWDDDAKRVSHGPLRTDSTVLQVAVARLLGYRWPAELDPKMELADEQREWVRRCDSLSKFVDRDGIVAIPAVKGEGNAKDRLLDMLAASYGDRWSTGVMSRLLAAADHADGNLESWLRDKFFAQHCRLFQNRPFIWQIWDGLRDGFSALVNCHKLDRRLLESLAWAYVGDWIARQTFDVGGGVEGAQTRLDAAVALQRRLEAILEGEAPYDIFVRWKLLAEQPLGWNPDINDGVRLNIRPFMMPPDIGRKGAGLLREKPNIVWAKDRGKDPESAPWYHLDGGDRINDRHLRRAEKEKART